MSRYERADVTVELIASKILAKFVTHEPLVRAQVKVDFIFAHPPVDADGFVTGDALKKNGVKALGLCRVIPLKDRAMGRGDVEISIDHPWWTDATDAEREALLDHELHHAEVKVKNGVIQRDDLHRPLIKLRKHDVEVGWFDIIALRHGESSMERIQAKKLFDNVGQLYWPEVAGATDSQLQNHGVDTVTIKSGEFEHTMSAESFSRVAKTLAAKPEPALC